MNDEAVEEYLQLMKKYEIPVPPTKYPMCLASLMARVQDSLYLITIKYKSHEKISSRLR
jgi:hypothetical protein